MLTIGIGTYFATLKMRKDLNDEYKEEHDNEMDGNDTFEDTAKQ